MKKKHPNSSSKTTRLSSFLRGSRKNTDRNDHSEIPPTIKSPSADALVVDEQRSCATAPSAPIQVETNAPASEDHGDALNFDGEEKLPASLVLVKQLLKKAGEELEKQLPQDSGASTKFEVKASADINALAESIGSTLEVMMDRSNVEKSKQKPAVRLLTEWAKKALPFVETGITVANNFIPAPYNLIASGLLFVKAQGMADVAAKVDDTMLALLLEIQNVSLVGDFSNVHVDEIRIAAMYLSAGVMDCLTSLIGWVTGSVLKKPFIQPDFDQQLTIIHRRSALYSMALQSKAIREKGFEDILEWISPKDRISITPKPRDKVAGTHQSFVKSEEYLNWVGEGPSALICTGRPGVGKSHLVYSLCRHPLSDISSVIFNRLREDPKLCMSYFFFNVSNRDETAENVIRVLLRQIVAQLRRVPGEVNAEYSRFQNDPHKVKPSLDTLASLLRSSLQAFSSSPSFILLDAYDEFRNADNDEGQRSDLCSSLSEICRDGSARILITTRPQYRDVLKDTFSESQIVVVKGDLIDVERHLDERMRPLKRLNNELKANIKKAILDANREDAWFLMVELQVKYILETNDSREKSKRLRDLPKTPTDAYRGVLERMTPDNQKFARRILGWVLHARRILKMHELQEALAIEIGVLSLNPQNITDAEAIISTCGGFVEHNQDTNSVTFTHQTVGRFLEEHELPSLPSHPALAQTCLTYLQILPLNWAEFEIRAYNTSTDQLKEKFKFIEYAASSWADHAVKSKRDIELESSILKTFTSDGRRDAMTLLENPYLVSKGKSLLHILIERRLAFIFMQPISTDQEFSLMYVSFSTGLIPSLTAAISLEKNINAGDWVDQTPLFYAAHYGDLQAVKWLLGNNADVNLVDPQRFTALHKAAYRGHLDIVKWLVEERNMDVYAKNNQGNTALHYAALGGHSEIVKWVVEERNMDVYAKNNHGNTALHEAAFWGDWEIVKWLVEEKNMDVYTKDNQGNTALHYAALGGHSEIVKWLVEERNMDVYAKNNEGNTALPEAALWGDWEIVKWLVEEKNMDVYTKDNQGNTALHYAALWGHLEIVKWLIERNMDVYTKNNEGNTALHSAAGEGKLEMVKWLVEERNMDVDAKNNEGNTALHKAAFGGELEIVEWLVEDRNMDIYAKSNEGNTALHCAAFGGRLEIVKWLVEVGKANIDVKNNNGKTASDVTRSKGISGYLAHRKVLTIPQSG